MRQTSRNKKCSRISGVRFLNGLPTAGRRIRAQARGGGGGTPTAVSSLFITPRGGGIPGSALAPTTKKRERGRINHIREGGREEGGKEGRKEGSITRLSETETREKKQHTTLADLKGQNFSFRLRGFHPVSAAEDADGRVARVRSDRKSRRPRPAAGRPARERGLSTAADHRQTNRQCCGGGGGGGGGSIAERSSVRGRRCGGGLYGRKRER